MFAYLGYMFIILSVIIGIIGIYNLYCFITIILAISAMRKSGKAKTDELKEVIKKFKYNIYLFIAKKSLTIVGIVRRSIIGAVISLVTALCILVSTILSIGMASTYFNIDTAITGAINTVVTEDENTGCVCYAKCTGDKSIDNRTAYELVFGKEEYNKIINAMKRDTSGSKEDINGESLSNLVTPAEVSKYDKLETSGDIKGIGELVNRYLESHKDSDMVKVYRNCLERNSWFKSNEKIDRTKMSNDELRLELMKFFRDVKTNGRNLNCPHCSKVATHLLAKTCSGEKHFKEDWAWETQWDKTESDEEADEDAVEEGTGGARLIAYGLPGAAEGPNTVTQPDGTTWYWFNQTAQKFAKANIKIPGFGNITMGEALVQAKNGTFTWTMAHAGCSIYALAITMSNILGREIDPYEITTKVLNHKITNVRGVAVIDCNENGTGQSRVGNFDMKVHKAQLIKRLKEYYNDEKLEIYEKAGLTEEYIKGLYDDKNYTTVIYGSYHGRGLPFIYNGDGHFMTIVGRRADGKYIMLTSAPVIYTSVTSEQASKMGVTAAQIVAHQKNTYIIIRKKNSTYRKSGKTKWLYPDGTIHNNPPKGGVSTEFNPLDGYGDIGNGSTGESGDTTASGWYIDIPNKKEGKKIGDIKITWLGRGSANVGVYKGLPWKSNNDTYFYNIRDAQDFVQKQFRDAGIQIRESSYNVTSSANTKAYGKIASPYINKDGKMAVGICTIPAMIDKKYVTSGRFLKYPGAIRPSGDMTSKLAIVMVKKGTPRSEWTNMKKWYTIPASSIDAKGHSGYYGVLQTNVKVDTRSASGKDSWVQLIRENWAGSTYFMRLKVQGKTVLEKLKYLDGFIAKGKRATATVEVCTAGSPEIKNAVYKNGGVTYSQVGGYVAGKWHMGMFGGSYIETYNMDGALGRYIDNNYIVIGFVVYNV